MHFERPQPHVQVNKCGQEKEIKSVEVLHPEGVRREFRSGMYQILERFLLLRREYRKQLFQPPDAVQYFFSTAYAGKEKEIFATLSFSHASSVVHCSIRLHPLIG